MAGAPIRLDQCFIRWQPVRPGQTRVQARVNNPIWAQTQADVTHTINHMNGDAGNVPLWLDGDYSALGYAGFVPLAQMNAQPGLNADNVVASLILPTGVAKLNKVQPNNELIGAANARQAQFIFGITLRNAANPLVPADYAYICNDNYIGLVGFKTAIRDFRDAVQANRQNPANPRPNRWVSITAVTSNNTFVPLQMDLAPLLP